MIPTARDLLSGAVFLGQRYGVDVPTATVIAAAHAEAVALATAEADEPAAIFFAFCRRARALRQGGASSRTSSR